MFLGGLDLGSFTPLVIGRDLKGAPHPTGNSSAGFSEAKGVEMKQNSLVDKWTKGQVNFSTNQNKYQQVSQPSFFSTNTQILHGNNYLYISP